MLSLFIPPRKDLLIGLGLVNVVDLVEFKAVLAHEFGHFAQRSTALGRYLYVANQVMRDVIYGRKYGLALTIPENPVNTLQLTHDSVVK